MRRWYFRLGMLTAVLLLASVITSPALAWPWSTAVTVNTAGTFSTPYRGALTCNSASLYANGRTYTGTISQSWWDQFWNRCPVSFQNVPVNTSATITISGRGLFSSVRGSKNVYISKPLTGSSFNAGDILMR